MRRTAFLVTVVLIGSLATTAPSAGARTRATATITVKPSKGLVQGRQVHVSGGGFAPNQPVVVAECKAPHTVGTSCDESNARFQIADANGRYSLDLAVNSTLIGTGVGLVNCTTRPGACIVSVTDNPGFDNTASVPISFAMTDVISRFSGDESSTVDAAAAALGVTEHDVARIGTFALAWVLTLTRTGKITPAPNKGPVEMIIHWLPPEYAVLTAAAAAHGTTTAEFQKTGALFLAYELGIS